MELRLTTVTIRLNRLTTLTQSLSSQPIASYAYTLGTAGNRLSVVNGDGSSIQWNYDDAYQLLAETRRDASNTIMSQTTYQYDAAGNRLSQSTGTQTITYTYNSLDQIGSAGSAQYQYDGRGNLTQITNGASVTSYKL